ncbi:hypothetical protein FVQ98_00035 [Ottowia sp. GY511]|uniref:Uroporphyrinogen-III C-methyltransferase n=1 Tax=Ottowia flava TaxID=2675430 RepID=A0ABW4KVV6_9BURK|nr:uroporphyrinogen-III C-methyltransferase [Ottowia sp. GY511]TXK33312.1 hypothetical protein FVQ98_00035 [Ottowia sp. GY511]
MTTPDSDTSTPPSALPSVPQASGAWPPPPIAPEALPPAAPPVSPPVAPPLGPGGPLPGQPQRSAFPPAVVAGWMVAIVALTVSVLLWQKVNGMQEALARQNADAGSQSVEARALARHADDAVRDSAAKLAALDARVADMAAYRTQLEELAHSASRARDENLAVDLETALRLAQDQTQLTGSTEPLLAALRTAERRLGRSQDPRLAPVARAVARDLERVKAATVADTAGLLGRIDQLLRQADDLPVANEVGRPSGVARAREPAAAEPTSWWGRLWANVRSETESLLRVRRIERPEATMLSPDQAFFVRENLKLRLQGARLGILARQYEAARNDLSAASTALGTWFDPASRRTQAAATLLQQVQSQTRSADLPRVDESLLALGHVAAAEPARSN